MRNGWRWWVGTIVLLASMAATAAPTVIYFEQLSDGTEVVDSTILTSQYDDLGVTFANAMVVTTGISLNEFEFPPSSQANIVFDVGGPMTIDFSVPMASVSGYFTYAVQLVLSAFDASGNELVSVTSMFDANFTSSGIAMPLELLEVVDSSAGIRRVVITGASTGESFTLDDLTFSRDEPVHGVPEPSTLLLVVAGVVGLTRRRGLAAG